MKLNNKGFALCSILMTISILAIVGMGFYSATIDGTPIQDTSNNQYITIEGHNKYHEDNNEK